MTGMDHREHSRLFSSGFTLVELQIAMLVMTLIALLMASALRATTQAWYKSTASQDVAEHRFLTDQFIRRHLTSMRFTRFQYGDTGTMLSFMGSSEALHFVAPYPGFDSDGSLYWWTLVNRRDEADEKERLVLEYLPYEQKDAVEYDSGVGIFITDKTPSQLVLDDAIRLQEIEYYIADNRGLDGWQREWEPGRLFPQAIRLRLIETDPLGNETELPEIAIVPRFSRQQLTYTDGG